MKSTRLPITALLLAVVSAHPACAALVSWTGADDDQYNNPANWDPAGVPNTNTGGDTAYIGSGSVIYPAAAGDLQIRNGNMLHIDGGSWTQTGGAAWVQLGGGTLQVTAGSFHHGTSENIVRDSGSSIIVTGGTATLRSGAGGNFEHNASHGTFTLEGTGTVNIGNHLIFGGASDSFTVGGTATINVTNEFVLSSSFQMSGGSLHARLFSFGGAGNIDFSGGLLSLDGSTSFNGFWGTGGDNGINFTEESTGVFLFRDSTIAVLNPFLSNGAIKYNGISDPSMFHLNETEDGVYVTLIPEPSASVLLLSGLAGTLLLRRRNPA